MHNSYIDRKLSRLGRTLVLGEMGRRLALAIAVGLISLAAIMLLDGLFELGLGTRQLFLTVAACVTGGLLIRALVTPITQHRGEDELALLSETENPEFDSRLISAVQFARQGPPGEQAPIIRSMVADTEAVARQHDFLSAVDWRYLGRALLTLVAVASVAVAGYFLFHKVTPTLLKRAFLSEVPIPRETQITADSGDLKIGIGDTINIGAMVTGVLPESGTLRLDFDGGRRLDFDLTKSETLEGDAGGEFNYLAQIEDVPESFTYQLRINDARSESRRVQAFARPEVISLGANQIYPEYTGIEPSDHGPGDFYLFPGGRIALKLEASKPLASATLRLIGLDEETEFNVEDGFARFDVPTENLTGFSITMRDTDGMEAKEPAVYRAELLGDEPPKVRITYPTRSDELVTKTARSLIGFEATDRFGIAKVMLNFKVGDAEPQGIELDIPEAEDGKAQTSLKHQFEWELAKVEPPLVIGDQIEYWITAEDRQLAGAGIGESEHLRLRVVSVADKRQDLLSRASDYLGGVGATTEDQERLNVDLGELIKAKAKQEDAGEAEGGE